ncbi:gp53-like domain-containing protein [Megamonas funiformis]|uniref:gp53-like domain-containing protein n=1 Tax=Megamonas funiformis TaxID=437897 RepID=UPI003F9AC263
MAIKQWGKAVGTNISVVNFPIAFTSTPYVGYLTRIASGNSGDNTVIVRNITTTQLYGEFAYGGADKGVYWLVIGK